MTAGDAASVEPWLARWDLIPDGAPIRTATSLLVPVRTKGRAAMLKLARVEEERFGNGLMVWWDGDGAAPVLAADEPTLLMARATGPELLSLFLTGREAEGVAALTDCLARLHRPRPDPPEAIPLAQRCRALLATDDPRLVAVAALACGLLSDPGPATILHGDAHPANFLDFGGVWLAIDPKRLVGPRVFDHTHLFVTPDLPFDPDRHDRLLPMLATAANLDPAHLLRWIAVSAALSAVWSIEDDEAPGHALSVVGWAVARICG